MIQVRNEENRYLHEVLKQLSDVADAIVAVDDASEDRTLEILRSYPKVIRIQRTRESLFREEWKLRLMLWTTAAATHPDWILCLDADEILEHTAVSQIRQLMNQDQYDWVGFRFFDMWGSRSHYREDEHWNSHKKHTMALVRYLPDYHYFYPAMQHHVPRFPASCYCLNGLSSDLRVQHLGWAGNSEERMEKYKRYKELDPDGYWGSIKQYESILDPSPRLLEWKEEPT